MFKIVFVVGKCMMEEHYSSYKEALSNLPKYPNGLLKECVVIHIDPATETLISETFGSGS